MCPDPIKLIGVEKNTFELINVAIEVELNVIEIRLEHE